jgi:tetratricopeptide (TPR) repeat protein
MRGGVVVAGFCVSGTLLWSAQDGGPPFRTIPDAKAGIPALLEAVDRYAAGDFDAAARYAETSRFDAVTFTTALDDWSGEGLVNSPARRRRALAFAIEVAWSFTRDQPISSRPRPGPSSALVPIVAWGCEAMPGASNPVERAWYLVSLSLLEHTRQWPLLIGGPITPPPVGKLKPVLMRESREGHVAHLKRHLPAEARVRLAELIAREGDALSVLITSGEARRPALIRFDEISEQRAAEIRANAPRGPVHQRRATALAALPRVESGFDALMSDPVVGGEAALHAGYLRLIQGDWRGAVDRLGRVQTASNEPYLQHLAHHFRGWAYFRSGQPAQAIDEYRQAVQLMPGARVVSTLLAEQLFLTDRRAEAFEILDRTFTPQTPAYEPLVWFKRGGARLLPLQLAEMRKALR